MNNQLIIDHTTSYVKKFHGKDTSGHDWWHIYRVVKLAKYIAQKEQADLFIVEMAALLHDIDDHKLNDSLLQNKSGKARSWLDSQLKDDSHIHHICQIIENVSFKGNSNFSVPPSLEGKVVQDADRLDAIGAIGIARAFAYGGHKKRAIYDPEIKPQKFNSFEEYKNCRSPSINHFYEKLLLLKSTMNTATAKQIAKEKHRFLETYLKQFFKEWNTEF